MDTGSDGLERTWDGHPISKDPPYGAVVVVYRLVGRQLDFLVLDRKHGGPDFDGDWAWGPPSGARYPDEPIDRCAERELFEETHLQLLPRRAGAEPSNWDVFLAEAPADAQVLLSDEHDRYAWLPLDRASAVVTPEIVRAQFVAAAGLIQASHETCLP